MPEVQHKSKNHWQTKNRSQQCLSLYQWEQNNHFWWSICCSDSGSKGNATSANSVIFLPPVIKLAEDDVDESVPVGSGFTLAEFFNMFVGSGVVTEKKFSLSSVVWCLSCRSTHGRGAVGSRSLPHSQLTRQLQVLEDWSSCDFYCFRTLTGTEWQHAADHGQLWTEKGQDRDVPHESLSSSSLNSTHSPVVDRLHLNTLNVFCLALQGLELLELYLFIFFSFNFTLILIFSLIEIKISFRFFRSHKILTKKM